MQTLGGLGRTTFAAAVTVSMYTLTNFPQGCTVFVALLIKEFEIIYTYALFMLGKSITSLTSYNMFLLLWVEEA